MGAAFSRDQGSKCRIFAAESRSHNTCHKRTNRKAGKIPVIRHGKDSLIAVFGYAIVRKNTIISKIRTS